MAYDIDTFGVLPGELALIAEEASIDVAFTLADKFGGTHIDFPKNLTKTHKVTRAIGVEAAKVIWKYWGGGRVRVPLAKQFRIRYLWMRGERTVDIAARVGVSDATIYASVQGMTRDVEPERFRSRLSVEADERARHVRKRLNEGAGTHDIASELKVRPTTVRELARRPLPEDEQRMAAR